MGFLLAFVAGYVVGGRGGSEGFDDVMAALKEVTNSQEFDDLIKALRSHASHALQELGRRLAIDVDEPMSMSTILQRARTFVQSEPTENAF
jgi:hypothetical protein